MNNQFLWT